MNMDSGQDWRSVADEADKWLDEGIAAYSRVEPRAGLEGRVLAGVAAAGREKGHWWGALAFSAAALALAMLWLGNGSRKTGLPQPVAKVAMPAELVPQRTGEAAAKGDESSVGTTPRPGRGGPRLVVQVRQRLTNATRPELPKLEQFPSPEPLSEQEQILMSYVAKYPETAALVAQARAEDLEQERKEEEAEAAQGNSE